MHQGAYYVQDASSMFLGHAVRHITEGLSAPVAYLDACAAPGGKSILAAEKAGSGRVLARDISEEKRSITEENIGRMRTGNIQTQVFDGTCTDETLLGRADVVLLDVPCSGLGVMGKKRDIKYRVTKKRPG